VWLYVTGKQTANGAYYYYTAGVLILSAITDVVDGFIARKFNLITHLGRILDPLADKLTQIAMMGCLAYRYLYLLIPLCALVVKELVCGIAGLIMIKQTGDTMNSKWYGKIATVVLYLMMILHLFWVNIDAIVSYILTIISTGLILLSLIMYLIIFIGKSIVGKKTE
jgi:cardiolipin synthase